MAVILLLLQALWPTGLTFAQSGPAKSSAPTLRVPNVVGKHPSAAVEQLFSAGLNPVVTYSRFHNNAFDAGKIIRQSPAANTPVNAGRNVTITVNAIPRPSMGIRVNPQQWEYPTGVSIEFVEDLQKKNRESVYTYIWHIDGVEVHRETLRGDSRRRSRFEHTYNESGRYQIQLDVVSNHPVYAQWRDSIRKDIDVVYQGQPTAAPVAPGGVPPAPAKPLGRWINRFAAHGGTDNLSICSSYWKAGYTYLSGLTVKSSPGEWSSCVPFDTVGAVDAFDLYTGEQADAYNTGYLAYIPAGRSEVVFRVYGFRFGNSRDYGGMKGYRHYEGRLDNHGKTPVPASIQWVARQSRSGVVQWLTEDDHLCLARIWKTKKSNASATITQNVFVNGGVDDLGCRNPLDGVGVGAPPSPSAISQANQIGAQFQDGQGLGGGTGLTDVTVSRNAVTLTFWDHGQVDGDIINIYLNGQLIKADLKLDGSRQSFPVTLMSGQNIFEVEAVNEGSVSPNTASVKISDVIAGKDTQIYQRKSSQRASMFLKAP